MNDDGYFSKAARVWQDYFDTRAGKKSMFDAMSRKKREEILDSMRKTIKPKESSLNDGELLRRIEQRKKEALDADIKSAFK